MSDKNFLARLVIALSIVAVFLVSAAQAQVTRPLLQEGKSALYQRVIAVPGARLASAPGDTAETRPVAPFTTYYVYERATRGGQEWLEVGTDSVGTIDGWLSANEAVDWKQTLTVGFRDPAENERVMLFGDRDSLKRLIDENDVATWRRLREQAAAGDTADSPW
jgi:serine/threonine-protein kinase PpkA